MTPLWDIARACLMVSLFVLVVTAVPLICAAVIVAMGGGIPGP